MSRELNAVDWEKIFNDVSSPDEMTTQLYL